MEENKTFTPDEGYFFGLGFFETIAVEKGQPLLLDWHLERLVDSCRLLGITFPCSAENVEKILSEKDCPEKGVLKIVASSENILFLTRENHYGPADYEKGFRLAYSKVRRNETSPLTYRKSLNYGDCILEKRAVRGTEIQEPIFLNTRGEIAEGATSNIFFVKDGILYTPEVDSGLLPGILRRWVLENAEKEGKPVVERRILPEDVKDFPHGHHAGDGAGRSGISEPEGDRKLDDEVRGFCIQSRLQVRVAFEQPPELSLWRIESPPPAYFEKKTRQGGFLIEKMAYLAFYLKLRPDTPSGGLYTDGEKGDYRRAPGFHGGTGGGCSG